MGGWEGSESFVMDAAPKCPCTAQPTPMHRSPRPVQPAHLDLWLGVVTQAHYVAGHHGRLVLLEAADGRFEVRRELIALGLALLVHGEGDVVRVELLVVLRRVRRGMGAHEGTPRGAAAWEPTHVQRAWGLLETPLLLLLLLGRAPAASSSPRA